LAAAFLHAEDVDPDASLAIGSLAVFAGPAPDFAEFRAAIGGRLPLVPRYRQRVHRSVLDLAAPAWVDDPDFDLRRHVRHTTLRAPGGRDEIARLMSRIMVRRLDRRRPLWEYWYVDGLADGRWALLSKVHHSVVDGVSGTDLYHLLLDPTPEPGGPVPDTWSPRPPAAGAVAAADALRSLVTAPADAVRRLVAAPVQVTTSALAAVLGGLRLAGALRPVTHTSLTGPLDGRRRYAWTTVTLSDVRSVRQASGVSVNDVALAAISGGFRRLLLSRGEEPGPRTLRALVPVSTRAPGEESVPDNRVTLMLPYLPVDIADPLERLTAAHHRVAELRDSHEPEAGLGITTLAEYEPFPWVSAAVHLGLRFPQRQIATVTTNVPGPRSTLYALGREVQEILPYVPIADRVRVGIAIFSYRDDLTFGLTADHTVTDLDVLTAGIEESFAELLTRARR
jgi:diacylglycerol O-acyltransferase